MQGQAIAGAAARLRSALAAVLVLPMPLLAADAATLERAEKIVHGKCFICHGIEGETSSQAFPRLAGQHATYLSRQLADFQSGRRKSGTMQPMVDGLTAEDFAALGVYFESRPVEAHPVADEALARSGRDLYQNGKPAAGIAACASCHGPQGLGTETLPRLAGQHALYIENQVRAFTQRERTNDNAVMQVIAAGLSEAEVKAVAAYISGLK